MASRMIVNRARILHSCAVLLAGSLVGCSTQLPTKPSPASAPAPRESVARNVYGIVIDRSGACIAGAIVEVIGGQGVGRKSAQSGPCDAWWPFNGFEFLNLTPGISLTLRATAPGHMAKELQVMPDLQPVEFRLDAAPREH